MYSKEGFYDDHERLILRWQCGVRCPLVFQLFLMSPNTQVYVCRLEPYEMTSTIASNPSRYAFGHHPPGSRPAAPINTSIFQPRSSDKCTWVSEAAFFDIDDEIEELDITLEDLKKGYAIIASALEVAQIPYAAVGGLAFTLLGARPEYLTHDVDFQVHTTPLKLFDVLRNMEK